MAKKMLDLTTERDAVGTLRDDEPAVVRVRLLKGRGQEQYYMMDGCRWPVPAWMRHLDGCSVRGVVGLLSVAATLWAWLGR